MLGPVQCKRHDVGAELFMNDKSNVDATLMEKQLH